MDVHRVEKAVIFYPDNDLVRKAVKGYPERLLGCVWPDPHDPGSAKLVRKALSAWGFRGVKLHPLFGAYLPHDGIVHPIMEEARRAKRPVLVHSGHEPFSLPWSIGELADTFPDVTIVMLHMGDGNGIYIQAAIDTAKRFGNIILETSHMTTYTKVKEAVEKLGDERVMYGSDYPFGETAIEVRRITVAGLKVPARPRLLRQRQSAVLPMTLLADF
jgi:predicted TIM-barrel fold metal-dependent hydrolase